MGWRFQKRLRLMSGITLNVSRKGVSTSIGTRGARITLGHGKTRTTLGVPGSGVSYTDVKASRKACQPVRSATDHPPARRLYRLAKLILVAVAIFIFALVFGGGNAWAINKCIGPDGKVSFQDAPCMGQGQAIDVRPASGHAVALPLQTAPAAAATLAPSAAKAEGPYGPTWQRRTYLENRGVADARSALDAHYRSCEAKQTELSNRKLMSRNNLAGATWEQSISAEMQALATTCDSRSRDLRGQLDAVERELRELQARQ